ncbi:hypothetical protein [Marinibactrum halimedae]|uniref:DNA-binding protein n=1 Tax=Marinibactrum halimedae TaxID=1444977 RepID=A0AA37T7G4_9GAMM|nr:hypothetical protein [Marinibactrum halimedae]MCD9459160.1 hypothetical protein [Marinibactrum halimedae]GLS24760.1 hypothetical protein GCM10007877_04740 [Marinibactrum halimedae]
MPTKIKDLPLDQIQFPELPEGPVTFNMPFPLMNQEEFAEKVGFRQGQMNTQINLGNIPTVKIGRLRLVNIAALTLQCMAQKDKD